MNRNRAELVRQLQAYRLKAGLTQDDIAWKLGFSIASISRWERGICEPDLRAIGAIIEFLDRASSHARAGPAGGGTIPAAGQKPDPASEPVSVRQARRA